MTTTVSAHLYTVTHYDTADWDENFDRPTTFNKTTLRATSRDDAITKASERLPAGHDVWGVRLDIDYDSPAAEAEFERIWSGESVGFSESKLRAHLEESQRLQVELHASRIRPHKIIGKGYKRPRQVAEDYLTRSIADAERDIAARGRTESVNRANVRARLLKAEGLW